MGKEATSDLRKNLYIDDLEENFEEDQTPFTTGIRLKEVFEQSPELTQLEEKSLEEKNQTEMFGEAEEKPLVGVFNKLKITAQDTKGKTHIIGAVDKGVLHAEKLQFKEKNPDLIFLCSINNSKVYYNIPKDEFWLEVYEPIWISHKRTMRKVGSLKLAPHDFETMLALSIAYQRNFHNPICRQIWVRKKVKKKIQKIIDKFEGEENT